MTVGVVCAIPQEWDYLRSILSIDHHERIAHLGFDVGTLGAHPVVLAAAGMCKVNSGLVATLLADRFGYRPIVFTGVAGGLDPQLRSVTSSSPIAWCSTTRGSSRTRDCAPYQPGHIPFINPTERFGYPVEPGLLGRVQRHLAGFTLPDLPAAAGGTGVAPRVAYGTVLSGDQYLHCEATRNRLHDEFGALAIEMEGGALAQVCEVFAIPWLVIRALSDLAGVDFNLFAEAIANSSARVLLYLLPALG
ncbi:5'-methylthioadenosine/S-adenosylhomocysteine nucleosidase [Mycobacterium tilburgii]|uniref:5'-methylthioadenosine/S-adenosylhomocysteine nucleosidase n=1 Tax=Mycobacterium tilburgii TaxID=44467 RepID=UPI0016425C78|nr:5'-methylthioadenosine/S-adenosylhomocysteine nucleosidase [Mycobacterium tilburgii]